MYHEPIAGQLSFAAINYNQLIELINIPCFFPPKSRSDKCARSQKKHFARRLTGNVRGLSPRIHLRDLRFGESVF
jgi:hypothetical protein